MDDVDTGQYERVRVRRAKRLVADYFSHLESLAKQGPSQDELVRSADGLECCTSILYRIRSLGTL